MKKAIGLFEYWEKHSTYESPAVLQAILGDVGMKAMKTVIMSDYAEFCRANNQRMILS